MRAKVLAEKQFQSAEGILWSRGETWGKGLNYDREKSCQNGVPSLCVHKCPWVPKGSPFQTAHTHLGLGLGLGD